MKTEDEHEIVEYLRDVLYKEIEREALTNLNLFVTCTGKNHVILSVHETVSCEEIVALPLLNEVKNSVGNSDDPRNQLDLAEGFERIAKWLRKDAARLDRKYPKLP